MNWFVIVKRYYDWKCYTNDDVKRFVINKKITEGEYELITKEPYAPFVPPTPPEEVPEEETPVEPVE